MYFEPHETSLQSGYVTVAGPAMTHGWPGGERSGALLLGDRFSDDVTHTRSVRRGHIAGEGRVQRMQHDGVSDSREERVDVVRQGCRARRDDDVGGAPDGRTSEAGDDGDACSAVRSGSAGTEVWTFAPE